MDTNVNVIRTNHKNLDHGLASPFMLEYLSPPKDVSLQESSFQIELDLPLLTDLKQTRRENVEIYYKVVTRPDSEKWMLLVNGFASSVKLWDFQQAHFLRNGYNLVMFDLLGQGKSSRPSGLRYSIESQVKIIEKLSEVTPLLDKTFYLIGASAGGIIAQAYALKNQDRLKALCLLSTTPKVDGRLAFTQEIQRLFLNNEDLSEKDKVSFCAHFLMDHVFSDMFFRKFKQVVDGSIQNNIQSNTSGTYMSALSSIDEFDVVDQLETINTPTLIFAGLHDKTIETHLGITRNKHIPNSRRYVFKGVHASHTFIIELFETFNEVIMKELAEIDQFKGSKTPIHVESGYFQEDPTDKDFDLEI